MKQHVLVTFSADWADEFDCNGFTVTTEDYWKQVTEEFKNAEEHTGFYFGTNEGWDSDEMNEDWLDNYKVKKIDKKEAKVIEKRFLKWGSYGVFPWPNELVEEEEDYEDD